MSLSISVKGFSGTENKDFKKHLSAVKFCIENELSFPIETSEFFKGKIGGGDLNDTRRSSILKWIENGIEVKLPVEKGGDYIIIDVAKIPKECTKIEISYS